VKRYVSCLALASALLVSATAAQAMQIARTNHAFGDVWEIVLSDLPSEQIKVKCAAQDSGGQYLATTISFVSGPADTVMLQVRGASDRVARFQCWQAN
jgi:hypothetical protein